VLGVYAATTLAKRRGAALDVGLASIPRCVDATLVPLAAAGRPRTGQPSVTYCDAIVPDTGKLLPAARGQDATRKAHVC
jgi:hypothetical protein